MYSINTFVDPEDPSHEDNDKTVDVTEVIKIIREKKTRPKLELPNDHDRKGPTGGINCELAHSTSSFCKTSNSLSVELHNDNESNKFMEKIPSKIDVGVKGKMDTHNDVHLSFDEIENNEQMDVNSPLKKSRPRSTLYLVTKSILLFVIPAVLIYMICASAKGNEPGDLQPRQLKPGKGGGYNQFLEGQDSEDSQQTRPFTGNHRPNRYPTPPGTEDENSGQGVAKRKTLNVLIRKVLEKKKREKQKNMEREQMEQEKKEAEKHRKETNKEAKNDKTNDGKPHVLKKSRFDTDDEEDESSLPPTPVKGMSMFIKRVKRRSPSPQKFKSEEKKQMDISCLGESAPVYESSGPFYDVNKCEQERKILECTDNSKVKACIRDNDEKSLLAVCTINICLYEYGNVGAECLNISGTSPQPIGTSKSVLVAAIIGLGIGFWCVKYRRGRHNQQNGNNASPVDQERNGGGYFTKLQIVRLRTSNNLQQIKLSKNVAACKLQSLDEDQTCLSEPRPSLETQSETEMEDTTCGAVDVYDSDDEFKIVKQKIEEEKNTGEDVKKTLAKSYKYPNHGQTGTTTAKKDDQCILITKTKGSNDFLAQCYEKDDCLPGVTSPKPATTNIPDVTLASTNSGELATEKEGNYFRFLALISISANAMRKAFDNLPYSFEDLLKRFEQTAKGHRQTKQLLQKSTVNQS
uniref:Uncharacterized protein n=1 Tax=Magallana gigas TaxID=29159 RepID=K1REE9_MAGGI